MATYPQAPSPFLRSGWVASQLVPNPQYHSAALTYLGTNNQNAGNPLVTPGNLSQAPTTAQVAPVQPQTTNPWQMPDWLQQIFGKSGTTDQAGNAKPAFLPTGTPALTQQASPASGSSLYSTSQFGSNMPQKKKRGFFGTILDLSPGSPTIFGIGG